MRIPHYLEKDGYFPLILSTNAIVIKEGFLHGPMSHRFQQSHRNLERIKIPFPARWEGKHIKDVRIIPVERARFFTVPFVYEAAEEAPPTLSPDKALAIDRGLDNLATGVNSTDGASFVLDGKYLKSLNHQYNARMAK